MQTVGDDASSFQIDTGGMMNSISAYGRTAFKVTFKPLSASLHQTTLNVLRDDIDTGTFGILLKGYGFDEAVLRNWRQLHFQNPDGTGTAADLGDFDGPAGRKV